MNKVYALVFDDAVLSRSRVIEFLDGRSEILNWHATAPLGLFFVVTELDAKALADLLHGEGGMRFLLVVAVEKKRFNSEVAGWLPTPSWDFVIREGPKAVPEGTVTQPEE